MYNILRNEVYLHMGLFGNKEDKEQKKLEKLNTKMEQLGLESLSIEEKKRVKLIMQEMYGTTLSILSADTAENTAKLSMLNVLVEQNWLLLRKLDSIETELKKLNNK